MAASFVNAGDDYDSDSDSDVVLTVPTGVIDDDLLIAIIGQVTPPSTAAPSGWTLWPTVSWDGTGLQPDVAVYYRVASGETAGSTSYSFATGAAGDAGLILAYRGMDPPDDPVSGYDNTHGTGDWNSTRDTTSPDIRRTVQASADVTAQPVIYIAHVQTNVTHSTPGHDHYNSATGAWDRGTEVYDNSRLKSNGLHSHWCVAWEQSTTTLDSNQCIMSWTGGENLVGDASMFVARLFGAFAVATTSEPGWGWHGERPMWQVTG